MLRTGPWKYTTISSLKNEEQMSTTAAIERSEKKLRKGLLKWQIPKGISLGIISLWQTLPKASDMYSETVNIENNKIIKIKTKYV